LEEIYAQRRRKSLPSGENLFWSVFVVFLRGIVDRGETLPLSL